MPRSRSNGSTTIRSTNCKSHLADLKPSALHVDLIDGVRKAKEIFEQNPTARHVLHVVSDFRARDWTGGSADALQQEIAALTQVEGPGGGAAVHLLDVADPPRNPTQRAVLDHGNTGILDLQPETRVAARYMPVDFTVTIANYTPAERKNVRVTSRSTARCREDASRRRSSASRPASRRQTLHGPTFEQLGLQPGHRQPGARGRRAGDRQHPLRGHRSPRESAAAVRRRRPGRRPREAGSGRLVLPPQAVPRRRPRVRRGPARRAGTRAAQPRPVPGHLSVQRPAAERQGPGQPGGVRPQRRRRRLLPRRGGQRRLLQPAAFRRRPRHVPGAALTADRTADASSRRPSASSTRRCRRSCSPAATIRS